MLCVIIIFGLHQFKKIPWSPIMSEMPAESKQKTDAKSLNQIITPILIGLVAEVLIGELKTLPPSMRLFSIILLGLVYGGITNSIGIKNLPISRRAASILTILFLFVGVLILLASFILNLDMLQTEALLVWLVVMILSLWLARSLPQSGSLARSLLTGAATVSLGAAIAIGGVPVAQFAMMGGTTDLLIQNNCDTDLINDALGLNVPAYNEQSKKFPAVSLTLQRSGNELAAQSQALSIALGSNVPFNTPIDACKKITIDGQLLGSGGSITLNLQESKSHIIRIDCSAC